MSKNSEKDWNPTERYGRKKSGAKVATNEPMPLEHSEPIEEVRAMSRCGHYTDSACADNTEQSPNWQSIGDLARKLAEKSDGDA